jgi:hypothetical protein
VGSGFVGMPCRNPFGNFPEAPGHELESFRSSGRVTACEGRGGSKLPSLRFGTVHVESFLRVQFTKFSRHALAGRYRRGQA